jgi:hydroxymethylbilane synthase
MTGSFRLGTRASPLAMAQAHLVRDALIAAHPAISIEICAQVASGDKILDRALAEVGGKALWTKELDAALSAGQIDFAVHSMKDVETLRPAEFVIAAMPERADVRDRLVGAASIAALKQGARFGTSAPRRRAQLLRLRPDLEIVLLRGNVNTRLAKIERGEADATLLAAAGLARLDMADVGTAIPIEALLPAPAQGAIGVECRADDDRMRGLLASINHVATFTCVSAERALLAGLSGDCRSPVAALALIDGGEIHFRAQIYAPDGRQCEAVDTRFGVDDLAAPGRIAAAMLAAAHPDIKATFG